MVLSGYKIKSVRRTTNSNKTKVLLVYLIVAVGAGLAIFFFSHFRHLENIQTTRNLETLSITTHDRVQQNVFKILDDLHLISYAVSMSPNSTKHYEVNLVRTGTLLEQCIQKNPSLLGVGWAPLLTAEETEGLVRYTTPYYKAQDIDYKYYSNFVQRYNNESEVGKLPVQLFETYSEDRSLIGYDLFSEYTNRKYAQIARDVGVITASDSILLKMDNREHWGYIVFAPVYKDLKRTADIGSNRTNIIGFIFGIFTVEDILTDITTQQNLPVSIDVYDSLLGSRSRLLYQKASSSGNLIMNKLSSELQQSTDIDVGGLKWSIELYSQNIAPNLVYTKLKWLVPIGILGIFSLLAMYAMHLVRYSEHVEKNVEQRTQELNSANEELNASYEELEALVEEMNDEHTKLVESENKLLESVNLFKTISENAPVMINCYDAEGKCILWNQECEKQLGYTKSEFSLFSCFMLKVLHLHNSNQKDYEYGKFKQVKGTSKSGKEYTHMWASFFLSNNSIVNVGYDTTTIFHLHELVFEKQKEESILLLAGGIAHDFNNILMGVLGSAEMLTDALAEDNIAQANEYCSTIRNASLRMAELTSQLLAYAKGGKYQSKPLQINDVIRDAYNIVKGSRFCNIKYHISLDPELWIVDADAAQVSQVVINLMINAIEAMSTHGGLLYVKTVNCNLNNYPYVPVGSTLSGEQICIIINDTGCGIPEDIIHKIFDPFFTTKFTGRGLGLAAVKGIISNHHGTIFVRSVLVQGTTFYIYLPKSMNTTDFAISRAGENYNGKQVINSSSYNTPISNSSDNLTKNILVVDDEAVVRNLAKKILMKFGYNVYQAASGSEAIKMFEKYSDILDLVLLDLQIPVISGFEVYEYIMSKRPDFKVVICSGYSKQVAEEGLNSNHQNFEFITKPYLPKELISVIEKSLRSTPLHC